MQSVYFKYVYAIVGIYVNNQRVCESRQHAIKYNKNMNNRHMLFTQPGKREYKDTNKHTNLFLPSCCLESQRRWVVCVVGAKI